MQLTQPLRRQPGGRNRSASVMEAKSDQEPETEMEITVRNNEIIARMLANEYLEVIKNEDAQNVHAFVLFNEWPSVSQTSGREIWHVAYGNVLVVPETPFRGVLVSPMRHVGTEPGDTKGLLLSFELPGQFVCGRIRRIYVLIALVFALIVLLFVRLNHPLS